MTNEKKQDKKNVDMDELFQKALDSAGSAYAPYSRFRVGAALLSDDGRIFTGCNVENRSYGLTVCAERTALFKGISEGAKRFIALAVSTPDSDKPTAPCGACRQVISEFMSPQAQVRFGGNSSERVNTTIGELYPFDSLHELNKA